MCPKPVVLCVDRGSLCGISPDAYAKDLLGPDILSRTPVALSAASVLPSGQH